MAIVDPAPYGADYPALAEADYPAPYRATNRNRTRIELREVLQESTIYLLALTGGCTYGER